MISVAYATGQDVQVGDVVWYEQRADGWPRWNSASDSGPTGVWAKAAVVWVCPDGLTFNTTTQHETEVWMWRYGDPNVIFLGRAGMVDAPALRNTECMCTAAQLLWAGHERGCAIARDHR